MRNNLSKFTDLLHFSLHRNTDQIKSRGYMCEGDLTPLYVNSLFYPV